MIQRTAQSTCDGCGWTSKWTSPPLADRALGQHSCARHRQRAAATARALAREAAIDRTPKPCHHKRANHQHGTPVAYTWDACRCLPCVGAYGAYESARVRQVAYGRWQPYVPAAPVRAHLVALMAQGMGAKRIAETSGIAYSSVSALLYGRQRANGLRPVTKLRPATAQALLAVRLDLAGGVRVDATGTRRRLQALVALGWSRSTLSGRLGMTPANTSQLYRHARVSQRTHRAVGALYEQLSMVRPPAQTHRQKISVARSLRTAREMGWAPPLAWDEEALDDPAARPRRDYLADLLEPVAWHHARGMSDAEISAALNRSQGTIASVRHRLGLAATRRGQGRRKAA